MKYSMNRILQSLSAAVVVCSALTVNSAEQPALRSLFNGRDFSGWTSEGYVVEDGAISSNPNEGTLRKDDVFTFSNIQIMEFGHGAVKSEANVTIPIRLACVGDSITQGDGLAADDSYPSQLQALLGEEWKVGNFGVSGRTLLKKGDHPYWTESAYQKALEFEPDVVIIMLGTNDTKEHN